MFWHISGPGLSILAQKFISSLCLCGSLGSFLSLLLGLSSLFGSLLGSQCSLLGSLMLLLSGFSGGNNWVLWESFLSCLSALNNSFLLFFFLFHFFQVGLESREIWLFLWDLDWVFLCWLWLINNGSNLSSNVLEGLNLSLLLLINSCELLFKLLNFGLSILLLFILVFRLSSLGSDLLEFSLIFSDNFLELNFLLSLWCSLTFLLLLNFLERFLGILKLSKSGNLLTLLGETVDLFFKLSLLFLLSQWLILS